MLKKYILLILFIGVVHLFVAGGVFATEALEDDQERIQKDREAIQSEISGVEASLIELVQELEKLNSQLSNINDEIVENEQMIVETEEKMRENEAEIKELELDIEQLQNDIDQRFQLLKDRASSYQKNGMDSTSYIEVILGSESFGDFVSRLVTISKIAQADSNFIKQLEVSQQELVDAQEEYEETLLELDNQVTELEKIHADIEEQREEAILVRDEVKKNEAEQEAFIVQLVDEDRDLASQEADIRERIAEEVRLQAVREAEREAQAKAESEAQAKAEREARAQSERDAQAKAEREARAQSERDAQAKADKDAQAKAEKESARKSVSRSNSSSDNNQNDSSGSTSEEGNWRTFSATAYTAYCVGCSGVTNTGIDLRANPNAKVIAVDPSVIPLGSRVEVKGYGIYLAGDTGGAIKGNKIDIFMADRSDALAFGRRNVQIRVLD